jgi:hypothetical protein
MPMNNARQNDDYTNMITLEPVRYIIPYETR